MARIVSKNQYEKFLADCYVTFVFPTLTVLIYEYANGI